MAINLSTAVTAGDGSHPTLHSQLASAFSLTTQVGNYQMLGLDATVLANAGITVTLPNLATAIVGKRYTVKNISTGTVVIAPPAGGATIDGAAASVSLTVRYASATFVTDGANYFQV